MAAAQENNPQRLVAQIRTLVEKHRERQLADQETGDSRAKALLLLLLLLVGGASAVLFVWLLDVNIGKPAQQAAYLANYDPLTGLPNRTLFQDRLQHAIAQADRNGSSLALLFFDLDHFKAVNDALGHHIGDELLTQAGSRLLNIVRSSDTAARLGGDEFAVIVENAVDQADVIHVANHIIESLKQPFSVADRQAYVSASIGITFYPADAEDANSLLKNADAAMYLAKQKGRGQYHFFTEELNRIAEQRLQLETQLRTALADERFELHFQPQLALADGRLVGAEALLRFKSTDELVAPDRFIPVLEDTGLILAVGEWVIAEACRWGAYWHAKTGYPLRIAVNLSVRQLHDRSLPDKIAAILDETGFPEPCLELEVTEGDLLDLSNTGKVLNDLRRLGVRLAIDDFGTGYSSLSYLKSFAVDLLKIDRSFIRDIHHDRDDDAVTSAIIALAHKLEIEVIAEGVETIEQQAFLTLQGCDLAQGYLLSRPMPTDAFDSWLVQRLARQRSQPQHSIDTAGL
jgi:diguanylate cyclase (GGDEF)-like protein